jgi:hypothetical protein
VNNFDLVCVTQIDPAYFRTLIQFERDSIPAGAIPLVHAPMSDRLSAGAVQPSSNSAQVGGGGCAGDPSQTSEVAA